MPTFADLIEVAYQRERVYARRLAKQLILAEEEALKRVMEIVAGEESLGTLISRRQKEKYEALTKVSAVKQAKKDARAKKIAASKADPNAWLAWFDGATHPNPGKMGVGGLLKKPDGEILETISFAAGQGDSSEAEYLALIAVLQAAVKAGVKKLIVYGDSRVVLDDVQTKTAGAPILSTHRIHAQQLITQLDDVTFIWIPRKKNEMADALSQRAVKLP